MIDNKTGIMFNTCAKACIYTSSNTCKSTKQKLLILLMTYIGRFFQIRDDYINLTCPKYWKLKGFCEDLDNDNVSYVLCILKHIYPKNRFKKLTNKLEIYKYLYKKNIFHVVFKILNTYKEKIIKIEQKITNKPILTSYLSEFFTKLEYLEPIHYNQLYKHIK